MNKVVNSFDEAVADVFDGAVILIGGFGPADGCPSNLIRALAKRGVKNLTVAGNSPGRGRELASWGVTGALRKTPPDYDDGGLLIQNGQVRKAICAFPGTPPPGMKAPLQEKLASGELEVELVPQGTLAERIRAAKAGISAFYTPVGVDTVIEQGKETRIIEGKKNILEYPLRADFALIHAYKADRWGNLVYRGTSRNFNAVMAGAARITIAEVDQLVPLGALEPEAIVTPSIYVNRVVARQPSGKGA